MESIFGFGFVRRRWRKITEGVRLIGEKLDEESKPLQTPNYGARSNASSLICRHCPSSPDLALPEEQFQRRKSEAKAIPDADVVQEFV